MPANRIKTGKMKKVLVIALCILWASNSSAQKLVAQASKTRLVVGEQFQVEFSIDAQCSGFKAPSLAEFDVYGGPNQSVGTEYNNGVLTHYIGISYILAPRKEGKFVIEAASVNVGGKRVESNTLTIEVVKAQSQQAQTQNQQEQSSASAKGTNENIFARSTVNRSKVYQGEQITVIHKVYTRLSLRGFQEVKFPPYNGFWVQDTPPKQIDLNPENVDGVIYSVADLRKSYLFPQRSGTLEIEPVEVSCVVRQRSNKAPQSVFEQIFGGGYEDAVYDLKSKPVKVEVMPLPEENKPANFSGAVGNYSFKADIDKEQVKANEAVNITIRISGEGNLKLIEAPKIKFPDDFETFDAKSSDNVTATGGGVKGSRTFEYLVIPRKEGDYTLNDISFSYFDPQKKSYITLPSPEFTIHVEKGKEDSNGQVPVITMKADVKTLGTDIRYIKTGDPDLRQKENHFFGSTGFYGAIGAPVLLFIGLIAARRRYIDQNSDLAAVKRRKATAMAKKRLAVAEKHLKADDKSGFYEEVFKALYGYLSDRLTIPVSDLSKESITNALRSRNVSEETCAQLNAQLQDCEFARYAPASVTGDLQNVYSQTVSLITLIENEIE